VNVLFRLLIAAFTILPSSPAATVPAAVPTLNTAAPPSPVIWEVEMLLMEIVRSADRSPPPVSPVPVEMLLEVGVPLNDANAALEFAVLRNVSMSGFTM
jgi:hypothetical protein